LRREKIEPEQRFCAEPGCNKPCKMRFCCTLHANRFHSRKRYERQRITVEQPKVGLPPEMQMQRPFRKSAWTASDMMHQPVEKFSKTVDRILGVEDILVPTGGTASEADIAARGEK
jgi:hypothetical protein